MTITIIETRAADETPTAAHISDAAEVLICRDANRRTSDGAVAKYLLGACVSTTAAEYARGEVEGLTTEELNWMTAYTVEDGSDETDGNDIAVPFVVQR